MAEQIKDGTGKGNLAKIDLNNRLHTRAVTNDEGQQATKDGKSYNINTGFITLTNTSETPVLYFKNNEESKVHITTIIIGCGSSTGGSGTNPKFRFSKNPSTGTTISNANDVDVTSNRNFSSSVDLQALAYKGATGETLTGNGDHILGFATANGRAVISIDEILERGNSLGVYITPQTGNSSVEVYVALVLHIEDTNDL